MNRRDFAQLIGKGAALLPAVPGWQATQQENAPGDELSLPGLPASPFDVANRAQLFVDRVLVREAERVCFTPHAAKKHPSNPLIRVDKPWEGWMIALYGSVLYDAEEKIFKMWYWGGGGAGVASVSTDCFSKNSAAFYATSNDGVTWEKPLVGTVPCAQWKRHNAVAACMQASVIKDNRDPDPSRRYKMTCFLHDVQSYHTMVSPDGLNWKQYSTAPIAPGSDDITCYYDKQRKLFVAFPKIGTEVRGHKRRVFYLITSRDFVNWTKPVLVWTPDLRDDAGSLARLEEVRSMLDAPDDPKQIRTEFYTIGVYQQESCMLAFPWVFTINNLSLYGNNHEGIDEIQLGISRDLQHWDRPFRLPCIQRGKPGEWDSGYFWTPSTALRVKDEIWLYFAGSNFSHGARCLYRTQDSGRGTQYTSSIGLAKWPLDRFVSVDGPREGGTLTTIPIKFSGNRLEINAKTGAAGNVAVEIMDAAGRSIAGFDRSDAFTGDNLRHIITWRGSPDISQFAAKPISLKFSLSDGELYSFAFRD